jgi:hypothetical protein
MSAPDGTGESAIVRRDISGNLVLWSPGAWWVYGPLWGEVIVNASAVRGEASGGA